MFWINQINDCFCIFYEKLKIIAIISFEKTIDMLAFLIMESFDSFQALVLIQYLRQKVNKDFAKCIIY